MVQIPLLTWEIMIGLIFLLLGLVLGMWKTNRSWFKCFVNPKLKKPCPSIKSLKLKLSPKAFFKCLIYGLAGFGALILVISIVNYFLR